MESLGMRLTPIYTHEKIQPLLRTRLRPRLNETISLTTPAGLCDSPLPPFAIEDVGEVGGTGKDGITS